MRISALVFASFSVLVACGSSGSTASTSSSGGGQTMTNCFDAMSMPTSTCAVTPAPDICAQGDANSCVNLDEVDVYADDGKAGVCLHLIFKNDCDSEIFADTCIEHADTEGSMPTWQCWTSSVLPGFTIDVSQCHATGKFFHVATASSGQLDILEQKCPAPM